MTSRFQRLFGRKATTGRYDKQDEERTLPDVIEQKTTIEKTDFKQKQREGDKIDEAVDREHDAEDKDANTDVKVASTSKYSEGAVLKTSAGTGGTRKAEGVYSRLFKLRTDYHLQPIEHSGASTFVPNCIPLYTLITSTLMLVGESNYAFKHERGFNPYAFAFGICYLQIIQILRAQQAAGELVGQDASALARFVKYNPLNGIMIPDPFIPFFESIVATKLQDTKYKWIVPSHGLNFEGGKTIQQLMGTSLIQILQPNIAFMFAVLNQFGASNRTELGNAINDDRTYIPIDIVNPDNAGTPQQVTVFGIATTFNGAINAAPNADLNSVRNAFTHMGANIPFQFWNDNYFDAHLKMRGSSYFVAHGSTFKTPNGPGRLGFTTVAQNAAQQHPYGLIDGSATTLRALDQLLCVAKENNPIWFQYISGQINTVARFFAGSRPFSQISTTGGMECTIITQLKLEANLGTQATREYTYADLNLGLTDYNQISFYTNRTADLTATFRTTRADIDRNEESMALLIGINANPPVESTTDRHMTLRTGQFFEDAIRHMSAMQMLHLGFDERNIAGEVPMYSQFHEEFVKPGFSKKPTDA